MKKLDDEQIKKELCKRKSKFNINKILGVDNTDFIPEPLSNFCLNMVRYISKFCMDDRWIPLSLLCAKLNLNYVIRCLRLPVAFVALAVLMIEVRLLFSIRVCILT